MTGLVIGAGVSGLGAAKLLRSKGETVRVSDNAKLKPEKAAPYQALGVELRDGGHDLSHLDGVASIVASPGLPSTHVLLQAAAARRLPVVSEIDLALRDFRGRLVAVTGTNGKSTTCAMLGHMLARAGESVSVGGNFGDPPSALLAEGRMGGIFVAELSSYQLEMSTLVAPEVAIFTSFSHDHLGRHGSLAGYLAAKWRVFARMRRDGLAIIPSAVVRLAEAHGLPPPECETLLHYHDESEMRQAGRPGYVLKDETVHYQTFEAVALSGLGLDGWQNFVNAAFVVPAVARLLNLSKIDAAALLRGFKGLPHRCELIGHIRGQPVINDSKSTNVESTLVALTGQKRPVLLMMGGQGKDEPYTPLLAETAKISAVITFGASGDEIAAALDGHVPIYRYPTLHAALGDVAALSEKHPGPILFSPGCASFDEFDNFEHRGQVFKSRLSAALDH
jgi:UDP-N-acetylmuramoylalanine--D-glutamate ligase